MEDARFVLDVIYLHGLGDGPDPSRPFLERLSERVGTDRVDVASPDLRALPAREGRASTLETVAAQIAGHNQRHGAGNRPPTLIVGHSVGAQIGLALAPHLASVRGFVAIEGAFFASVASPFRRYAPDEPDGRGRERLIADLEALEAPTDRERAYLRAVRDTDGRLFDALARELVDRWAETREQFEQLEVPRLYVAGAASVGDEALDWADNVDAESLEAAIVEDAGHNPHYDRPARVAEICEVWGERSSLWD